METLEQMQMTNCGESGRGDWISAAWSLGRAIRVRGRGEGVCTATEHVWLNAVRSNELADIIKHPCGTNRWQLVMQQNEGGRMIRSALPVAAGRYHRGEAARANCTFHVSVAQLIWEACAVMFAIKIYIHIFPFLVEFTCLASRLNQNRWRPIEAVSVNFMMHKKTPLYTVDTDSIPLFFTF